MNQVIGISLLGSSGQMSLTSGLKAAVTECCQQFETSMKSWLTVCLCSCQLQLVMECCNLHALQTAVPL